MLQFFFSFEGARPDQILYVEYFTKIHSEMNSTQPYHPILIPNTPYVKKKYLTGFQRGPSGSKKSKLNIVIFQACL